MKIIDVENNAKWQISMITEHIATKCTYVFGTMHIKYMYIRYMYTMNAGHTACNVVIILVKTAGLVQMVLLIWIY